MKAQDVILFGALGYAAISEESAAILGVDKMPEHKKIIRIYGKTGMALARCNMFELFARRVAAEEFKAGHKMIFIDPVLRSNADVQYGDEVLVRRATALTYADMVEVTPIQEELEVVVPEELSKRFSGMPILAGNLLIYDREVEGELKGVLYRITRTVPEWYSGLIIRPEGGTKFTIRK